LNNLSTYRRANKRRWQQRKRRIYKEKLDTSIWNDDQDMEEKESTKKIKIKYTRRWHNRYSEQIEMLDIAKQRRENDSYNINELATEDRRGY